MPTRTGKKFAGWSTTNNAEDPDENLGNVKVATTIYAVWYDFYTVSFETNPETHATETVQVPKHGTVSVEGFAVPATYTVADPQNPGTPIKYYFTGWGNRSKMLDVGVDPTAEDTVHLADIDVVDNVNLYAVWTKAKTFSVTFDATLHGKTDVRLIKIVIEGDPVSKPNSDDFITDAGYKVAGWCVDVNCTEEYNFDLPLEGNLTLYARWDVVLYSISYENMNGASNAGNPSNYNIGSGDIVFADPTKEGATFVGWFYDAEFTNPATQIDAGSTGDKVIYAKWNPIIYTIQYLSGNLVTATAKNDTKIYGETISLKTAQSQFAIAGCTQDGWSKVDFGQDGHGIDYELGASYADNADLKLFPHWTCNAYGITYVITGAEGIAINHADNPDQYVGPGKLTLKNAYDSAKTKRIFMDDWFLEATFENKIRDIQKINAPITVYAKWYNKIIYNPGSRLKAVNSKLGSTTDKKFLDSTYTFRESIKDFVLTNYTLDGWSTTDGGEKVYELGETYTTNANLTLYPHWVESRDSVQYGAVKIYTYATDGRKEAVINGNYGGGDEPNLEEADETVISSDITVNSVTLNRTFNAGKIATLYVPFEIDAENVAGTEVYKFKTVVKSDVDNRWKFKVSTATKIMPNTPYVIIPEGTQVTFDIPTSVTLNTTTEGEATAANNWEFIGAYQYEKFTIDNNNPIYLFANEERDGAKLGEFVKIAEGAFINPLRAYLVYHKALAKSASGTLGSNILLPDELDIEIENENGIVVQTGTLNTVTGEVRMDRWYDLKGRKLNSKPTVKGTYYKNGKRVVIK